VGQGASGVATNTALGTTALSSNTTGNYNTAIGANTLSVNTIGYNNTRLLVAMLLRLIRRDFLT
jgi:hypothetical protein